MNYTHEQALERIRDLEAALNQNNTTLAITFRLTPALSNLLGLLISVPIATPDMVRQRLEIATDPKVAIHRLRRHLAAFDIKIHTTRSMGYWLNAETKERVKRMAEALPGLEELTSPEQAAAQAA